MCARNGRFELREGGRDVGMIIKLLLFFLVAGMASLGRDFAYVGLSQTGLPIYVTEIVLAISAVLLIRNLVLAPSLRARISTSINIPLALYWLWGLVLLTFALPNYGFDAIRDFAVVYYSLFIFVTIVALHTLNDIHQLLYVIVFANLLPSSQVLQQIVQGQFEITDMYLRFVSGEIGLFGVISFCAVLVTYVLRAKSHGRRQWRLLMLPIFFAGIIGTQHRSLLMSFAAALMVSLVALPREARLPLIKIGIIVWFILAGIVIAVPNGITVLSVQSSKYLAILDMDEGSNAVRLVNYEYALNSISDNPVWGVGLGAPEVFFYGGTETLPVRSPHDSYLGVAFRMGLVGLVLFLLFLATFYLWSLRRIVRIADTELRGYAVVVLACQLAVALMALFNVTLEGPQNGIMFWILIGAELRVIQIAEGANVSVGRKYGHQESRLITERPLPGEAWT